MALSISEKLDIELLNAIAENEAPFDGDNISRIATSLVYARAYGLPKRERRSARVSPSRGATQKQVQHYLPGNFVAVQYASGLYVIGYDNAGWTLQDYVIPRLASGLIAVSEVA